MSANKMGFLSDLLTKPSSEVSFVDKSVVLT